MKIETDHDRAGRDAVGVSFNPSNSHEVEELKNLFAKAFSIVEASVEPDDGTLVTARKRKMRDAALQNIITAQM